MRTFLPALLLLPGCMQPTGPGSPCEESATRVRCEHQTLRLDLGDATRDVHYQAPAGAPPDAGWPAVIVFQGALFPAGLNWFAVRGEPYGGFHQAQLTARLLDAGYLVLTPEAAGEGLTCWDTNLPRWSQDWAASPDAALMDALLDGLAQDTFGPADLDALYAVGISSGGYMASRMAISYPGMFQRLAIASASYATCAGVLCRRPDDLPPDHPPTLFLHGGLDAVVPIWTMFAYRDALEEAGVEVDTEIRPLAGHGWTKDAPEAVVGWLDGG